jgi:hypothetical protein
MALSNMIPGKKRAIERSGGGRETLAPDRPANAPCFVRSHDEPEPNAIAGEALLPEPRRPAPVPTRSMIEAHRRGHSVETAGITQAEIDAADAELLAREAEMAEKRA